MKVMITVFLSTLLLLYFIMSCSVYIRLNPPESVVLVAFRMPYQMFSKYLNIAAAVGIVAYLVVMLIKGLKPGKYSLILAGGFCICFIMGIVYSLRITAATAQVSGMQYEKFDKSNLNYNVEIEDLHAQLNVMQCSVATPVGSPYAENCAVYLNYGGWSAQDEKMGGYLEKLVTGLGYSYVRFVGMEKEQGNITDIVKSVKNRLKILAEEKQYKKIVLLGASAGGNIALITAFSNELSDVYGDSLFVNGVVGLYPMTDMESAYDYFVEHAKGSSMLGKLGDKLYCGIYGNKSGTGTFAGETKKLDETVFGVKAGGNCFYQEATVLNLIGKQNIPTLLIGGNADSMVVVTDTQKLFQYMEDKGMDCAYLELPNVEHAFDIMDTTARKRACVEIEKWLYNVFSNHRKGRAEDMLLEKNGSNEDRKFTAASCGSLKKPE